MINTDKEAKKLEANDHNCNIDLDEAIRQVKEEFKNIFAKRRDLIIKLGEAFERTVSNSESICEEIKSELRDEIAKGLISSRDIERYCPDKWKKKTKPKKEQKNDNLSFSPQKQQVVPRLMVDTYGNPVTEPATSPSSDSNNDINKKESAIEEDKYTDNLPGGNDLENKIRKSANVDQQLLSEQVRIKELAAKVERLEIDLQSKLNENNQLKSQVEGLESKSGARSHNDLNQEDKKL
jgi:hypothetical protein